MYKHNDEPARLSDVELVARINGGDCNMFAELISRYQAYVLTIINRHVPHQLVEDTAQDSFFRIYKSIDSYRPVGNFKTWLSSITVRTCYDVMRVYYRSREMTATALSDNQQQWLDQFAADEAGEQYARLAQQKEAKEILDQALNKLTPAERIVLELVHLEGYSGKEAARLLDWSVANVKIKAYRARKKMRKYLEMQLEKGKGKLYDVIS